MKILPCAGDNPEMKKTTLEPTYPKYNVYKRPRSKGVQKTVNSCSAPDIYGHGLNRVPLSCCSAKVMSQTLLLNYLGGIEIKSISCLHEIRRHVLSEPVCWQMTARRSQVMPILRLLVKSDIRYRGLKLKWH